MAEGVEEGEEGEEGRKGGGEESFVCDMPF